MAVVECCLGVLWLYTTRVQKERFDDMKQYTQVGAVIVRRVAHLHVELAVLHACW
jgi:aspartate carbamoyltransferase catalytic subunit